jgi:hypothetical protein
LAQKNLMPELVANSQKLLQKASDETI